MNTTTRALASAALLCALFGSSSSLAFNLEVVDPDGNAVSGFRWLLEEDNTHDPQPGVHRDVFPGAPEANTLSVSIHKSHAPVVSRGETTGNSDTVDTTANGTALADGRYALSVLPFSGYTMGGTTVEIAGGIATSGGGLPLPVADDVTVVVAPQPIATAQLAIKVFHDIRPLNNVPDATEPGLENFRIEITDAGGDIVQDAFGNKLGTRYEQDCDANGENPGTGNEFCLDPDGAPIVAQPGAGTFLTDADGEVLIKNLRPNKYGVQAKPPGGQTGWYQTTTIEGTPTIDAWVGPEEPDFLLEFGPPFWHAFYGFVQELDRLDEFNPGGAPTTTITGQVRKGHQSRPPSIEFYDGAPPSTSTCLIGLNLLQAGVQQNAVWIGTCDDDGFFTIPGVPPGTYQLVAWDVFLDQIIFFTNLVVDGSGATIELGTLPVPMWFGEQEHWVYFDANRNGVRDPGEIGISEQNVNLRFRDGTIYKAFPTDLQGFVPFEEIFPFFHFQVAEVDFARFRATGLAIAGDDGGPVTNDADDEGKRNANATVNSVQPGPVLTQAYQIFAGQNTRYEWGKALYDDDINAPPYPGFPGPGDLDVGSDGAYRNNGGISGIVYYAVTRAEDDPRFAAGEEWEPGVPRVQVNLYRDTIDNQTGEPLAFGDGAIDPKDPLATFPYDPDVDVLLADVDNHPLGDFPGPGDVDRNLDGIFDLGDAILVTYTDSWDDSLPAGCAGTSDPLSIHGTPVPIADCSEGLRTWNQNVEGVFDGGYAFGSLVSDEEAELLVPGTYIVEAATPPGYVLLKEEDRNVDFGDTPIPFLLPAPCVGDAHTVPDLFSFLTLSDNFTPLPGVDPLDPDNAAPFAGDSRPLCDRKQVRLTSGQNAAADFFLFTDVPRAARVVGLITDDLANENAPGKPNFVEKFSPGWIPVTIRDYSGKKILRTYSDEYGAYNALLSSTYNIDLPTPTGVGPQMHEVCLNDPGEDVANPDPRYRPQYSTTCYRFDFWPGKTTYLDTPVVRIAAFTGPLQSTLDCEPADGTPRIAEVVGSGGRPAYVDGSGSSFSIDSFGPTQVPNPDFPGDTMPADGFPDDPPAPGVPETVERDYGFGGMPGGVWIGDYQVPATQLDWSDDTITVHLPDDAVAGGLQTGRLRIVSANGKEATATVTLTVGATEPASMAIHDVFPGDSIQAAIDAADEDDLILVRPGTYRENVIVYKRVRVQGAGTGHTILDATRSANPIEDWQDTLDALVGLGQIGLLPGQELVDPLFRGQEGPGFLVAPVDGVFSSLSGSANARIDGFTVRGASGGGGIFANAFAYDLEISNSRLIHNEGVLGGGIRIGNPLQTVLAGFPQELPPSPNPRVHVHHAEVIANGSQRTGGGISLFAGADGYAVEDSVLCGNFSRLGGGGIGHNGLSDGGTIARNVIAYNEVFQGDEIGGGGGGIEITGEPAAVPTDLTDGTGSVTIDRNLIQGNLGGAADGGGIALRAVNGVDTVGPSPQPHAIGIFNNIVANNVTGVAGGGISLQDAVAVRIAHNTIARNDSAATASQTFGANFPNGPTTPQIAGIASRAHSGLLAEAVGAGFSDPQLHSNIVWENRSFFWTAIGGLEPRMPADGGPHADLGVIPDAAGSLTCVNCVLTGGGPVPFRDPFENQLATAAAADEGGNFVQILYGPLGVTGNYHLAARLAGSGATPNDPELEVDIDRQPRRKLDADVGADRWFGACGLGFEAALILPLLAAGRRLLRNRPRA